MIIGDLRKNIIVKQLVISRDSTNGSTIETWETKYNLKAKVTRRSGAKTINNNEIFNTLSVVFITHFREIEETDRIEYDEDNYKIMMIGEIGEKEGLEIIAEKINE
jgi:SPP1 family predicted phage head-tail adaptor